MRRMWAAGVVLLCLLHASAQAADLRAPLRQAEQALAQHDYTRAARLFARHAARNPLAQFNLGLIAAHGWGRASDPVAACGGFRKAAAAAIPAAQQQMGDCLARGIGGRVDGVGAVQRYRQAATAGIAWAGCQAGELYLAGAIVAHDPVQGLALCTAAAQAESVAAMRRLGELYLSGKWLPQDLALARHWTRLAAERHDHQAQVQLGHMLVQGLGGAADPAQALFWLAQAARAGHAAAYLPCAILYANAAPDPATGALRPHDLAQVYVWTRAARTVLQDVDGLAEIVRIERLLERVVPAQWRPALDRQLDAHLTRHQHADAAAGVL